MEENPNNIVVLSSKYSTECQKLLKRAAAFNNIQFICIDNKTIRHKIAMSNKIQILSVPCVLFIYPSGQIEKFEGMHASRWLQSQVGPTQPPPVPMVPAAPVAAPAPAVSAPISTIAQAVPAIASAIVPETPVIPPTVSYPQPAIETGAAGAAVAAGAAGAGGPNGYQLGQPIPPVIQHEIEQQQLKQQLQQQRPKEAKSISEIAMQMQHSREQDMDILNPTMTTSIGATVIGK